MSFLSSLASKFGKTDEGGIGDDNSAIAAMDDNPYLAGPVFAARNAYDAMYSAVRWMAEGKRKSLETIDSWLREWEREIDRIVKQYEELLKKINDIAASAEATFTLDLAKEAWETIQDAPELRRYMGEANYWYLHDTLGLLATQTGSMTAELMEGVKAALKATILAVLSATDGLLQVESYYGKIAQYWGGLYQKMVPLPLTDSICPQVTCAYYYKPTHVTKMDGYELQNPVPGDGFSPIPMPLPDFDTMKRYGAPSAFPDYQDPETWYADGVGNTPWYIQSSMDLFWRSLSYWGSSYRDAVPPLVGIVYGQRDYTAREDGEHPLQVGRTFAQLDTDYTVVAGGNTASSDLRGLLSGVFSDSVMEYARQWQSAYERMREIVAQWAVDNGVTTVTGIAEHGLTEALIAYLSGNTEYSSLEGTFISSWKGMAEAYGAEHPSSTDPYADMYRDALSALQVAASASGDLGAGHVFGMEISGSTGSYGGLKCMVCSTAWAPGVTIDYSEVFGVGRFTLPLKREFVMFPQAYTPSMYREALVTPVNVTRAFSVLANGIDIDVGEASVTEESEILRYSYGEAWNATDTVGLPPTALSDPEAMGTTLPLVTPSLLGGPEWLVRCSLLFPDGNILEDGEITATPDTFVTRYDKYMDVYDAGEELADQVGYSVREGRETLFPCFGVYGEWLGMKSWDFREMPTSVFSKDYARCRSGSDLYYERTNPAHVVFRHSRYYSDSRNLSYTVYHEALAESTRAAGEESYRFLVFPTESVSIGTHTEGDYDLGSLWPVNVTKDGVGYRYITMRNAIPRCPKYVDPEMWSFMDLVHELYFLAQNLSGMCADNGQRMKDLEDILSDFGLEPPEFIGQLPANNGEHVDYKFTIFQQYADRLKKALTNVYSLRDKIFKATENW